MSPAHHKNDHEMQLLMLFYCSCMDSGPKAILLILEFISSSAQSNGDTQRKEENKEVHHKERLSTQNTILLQVYTCDLFLVIIYAHRASDSEFLLAV